MNHSRQRRRSLATRGAALTAALTFVLAPPAFAQDVAEETDPDLSELPAGPPQTDTATEADTGTEGSGTGIDLSGVVETDDEGNIIWNVETDTVDADEVVVEPTAIPETGLTGTGDIDAPALDEPQTDSGGGLEEAKAGTGNGLLLVLAIGGGVLVLAAAGFFLARTRRQRKEELDQIEEVIDPLANERLAGEFAEPLLL